jgi:hypothetical protein
VSAFRSIQLLLLLEPFLVCVYFVVTITGRVFTGAAPRALALLLSLRSLLTLCFCVPCCAEREREGERKIENERQEER